MTLRGGWVQQPTGNDTEAAMMTGALTLQDLFATDVPYDRNANPADEDLAIGVITALRKFESAVNEAVRAGIEVVPCFERVAGRLPGVSESYVARVEMFRKAS